MGIGARSCAHWRSTQEHLLEGTVWIYGFWTGLTSVAAASDQSEVKIDMAAIVEVKKDMRSANVENISQRCMDHLCMDHLRDSSTQHGARFPACRDRIERAKK